MDHYYEQPQSLARGVNAAAPYVARPPSPPYIHVPSVIQKGLSTVSIVPSLDNIDTCRLTQADLAIITQNKAQLAEDGFNTWRYESRRQAQAILDFLYLGPSSIAKNKEYLQKEGITMLLAARDSMMAQARLMRVEETAQDLGIAADYIDVSNRQELIRAFPIAVEKINAHLLEVYRGQAIQNAPVGNLQEGQIAIDSANFKRGKVLVFCETGNDRSATIVAAYIMATYGQELVKTVQFISMQRFCVNFDDQAKFLLQSYEDILKAERAVGRVMSQPGQNPLTVAAPTKAKRSIEETMDVDDDEPMAPAGPVSYPDGDRYVGRNAFAPFVERTDGRV